MIRAAFRPLVREWRIAFYRWALREIDPMHDDVPRIVLRLRNLLAERYARPCYLQSVWRWL